MSRGFGIPATPDAARAQSIAAEIESLGYATVWTNDTPGGDGVLTARHMLEATGNVRVGIGVIACDRKPPSEIAHALKSWGIPLDRLIVGLGAGSSTRPLKTVREAVGTLRRELGGGVTIGVAAMGAQMCRLAGEHADLVLFNWMLPERIVWAGKQVCRGEARRNNLARVERVAYVRVALGAEGRELVRSEAARYSRFPAYGRHFQAMGAPLDRVGIAEEPGKIPPALAAYDSVLDETAVRALPARDSVESTLAVGRAAAPNAVH